MDKQESEIENIDENKNWIRNFSISIIIHLLFIALFIFFYGLQDERGKINSLFYCRHKEFVNPKANLMEEQMDDPIKQEQLLPNEQTTEAVQELKTVSFSDIIADTTNLDQVYTEPTLNVFN
ncbi:MAG: hypothetical protein MZV64_39135 [Ignavibacteriales bacterium]|nr:hypothetical protein [Ignavibacteriales bacterium]